MRQATLGDMGDTINEQERLAQLIRDIQAEGDVGAMALAGALMSQGVRLSAEPTTLDVQHRQERVEQMLRYAADMLGQGNWAVSRAFAGSSDQTQQAFASHLRERLRGNPFFYMGMQTTGETVRAVSDVPELSAAYNQMTPEERAGWVSSLRDAWHHFAQAAALGARPL